MSEAESATQSRGMVHASRYEANSSGKHVLRATIKCHDGITRILEYDELSPYHAFADREVEVWGQSYGPHGQIVCLRDAGFMNQGHLCVAYDL